MTPTKLATRPGDRGQAKGPAGVADTYLEVARLVESEDGTSEDVRVGLASFAGIATGDAICLSASRERYSGSDHWSAANLLGRVDGGLGKNLKKLVSFKPARHDGQHLLGGTDRGLALRAAQTLGEEDATVATAESAADDDPASRRARNMCVSPADGSCLL